MAKTWLVVLLLILSSVFGYVMFGFWNDIRPGDEDMIKYGAAVVVWLASFTCLYFLTKGGGGGGD